MQVSGKTRKPKPGSRNTSYLLESEWIRVPGAHEAIVSAAVFEQAQAAAWRFTKSGKAGSHAPFAGKIYCGVCGHALEYSRGKESVYYCGSHRFDPACRCFSGRIPAKDISAVLLATVKVEAAKALDIRQKRRKAAQNLSHDRDAALLEMKRLAAQIARLERRSVALYEDFVSGALDRDAYLAAKAECAAELAGAESHISKLDSVLAIRETRSAALDDEPILRRVLDAEDVTGEILSLVERIVIHDPERMEIRFAFGDKNNLQTAHAQEV
jgi:hypothetical protein